MCIGKLSERTSGGELGPNKSCYRSTPHTDSTVLCAGLETYFIQLYLVISPVFDKSAPSEDDESVSGNLSENGSLTRLQTVVKTSVQFIILIIVIVTIDILRTPVSKVSDAIDFLEKHVRVVKL